MAAIAGTAAYARGWDAAASLALAAGIALLGYPAANLLLRGSSRDAPPDPRTAPRSAARPDPVERRRVLTDRDFDENS